MNTPDTELKHCLTCNQMTNHKGEKCLKHTPDNWNEDMERNEELMNMNTPDTESEPYSGEFDTTKKNWTVKELRKMAKEIFTPDTEGEIDEQVKEIMYAKDVDWNWDMQKDTLTYSKSYQLHSKIRQALSSHTTYWKERVSKKDDLLDDMWGLICNVNGGIVENEKEEWYQAFLRIRTKYFTNLDNLK